MLLQLFFSQNPLPTARFKSFLAARTNFPNLSSENSCRQAQKIFSGLPSPKGDSAAWKLLNLAVGRGSEKKPPLSFCFFRGSTAICTALSTAPFCPQHRSICNTFRLRHCAIRGAPLIDTVSFFAKHCFYFVKRSKKLCAGFRDLLFKNKKSTEEPQNLGSSVLLILNIDFFL